MFGSTEKLLSLSCVLLLITGSGYSKPVKPITVSLKLEWDENLVGKAKPSVETVDTAANTTLFDILVQASTQNPDYTFTATHHTWGWHITSISNVVQDKTSNYYWMIYDGDALTPTGVSTYKPSHMAIITFKYEHVGL